MTYVVPHTGDVDRNTKQSGPHAGETGTANEITKFLPPSAPKAAPEPSWQQQSWKNGAF